MSSKIKVDTIEDVAGTSNISIGTNLTMDVAGDITLDAGGADVKLSDDGTNFLTFTKSSNDVTINDNNTFTSVNNTEPDPTIINL